MRTRLKAQFPAPQGLDNRGEGVCGTEFLSRAIDEGSHRGLGNAKALTDIGLVQAESCPGENIPLPRAQQLALAITPAQFSSLCPTVGGE